MFLMPSRYEPCGLNQLYSLRYGTVPIVTATGGLADTVVDVSSETLANGTATGFQVPHFSATQLDATLGRALRLWAHEKKIWKNLVETGMKQDWSWRRSAAQYEALYVESLSLARPGRE